MTATFTPGDFADPRAGLNSVSPHRLIDHRWVSSDWGRWQRKVVTQDGDQSFARTVVDGYGRVTGPAAGGNQREMYLLRDARWIDGEVTALFKGPSVYTGGNRPQMGLCLRYQEIDGYHTAFVVWYDSFAGNPRVVNLSAWRGNGSTVLNQGAGGQYTAGIARDLRVLGVRRFEFLTNWINEYACQPFHLHGLAAGDSITTDVDDNTFDANAESVANPDREKGTFQLAETTTTSAVAYKAADGTVQLVDSAQRFFSLAVKARLVDNTIWVKAWRGRYDAEPGDWQAQVTVAPDADFPTLPSGPGLFGVVVGHAHSGSYAEFGDITFRRL